MKEIHTEIEINASPARVWEILADFARFPEWNPLVPEASGELRPGGRLRVRVVAGREMIFRPVVTAFEPQRVLAWRGVTLLGALFTGEHRFAIEPLSAEKVRFVHSEVFSGLLVPLLASTLERDARPAFERMNRALKARAEESAPAK
jgi:hypothetical protein